MEIEKREYYISLYDIYGSLLTDKQRNYFENYYFDDYSLSEIAINYNISRNGVFDQIKRVINTLINYEEKLKLLNKYNNISESDIDDDIKEKIFAILKE